MDSSRSARVAARFAAKAEQYERHATLQAEVAERLAGLLPELAAPEVLEIGCGTGLLTRRLLARYPDGRFLVSDLAPGMLEICRGRVAPRAGQALRFAVMDGEAPGLTERFDLVASSMALQWMSDPVRALESWRALLKPGGHLVFATLGPGSFPEWRAALAAEDVADGTVRMPRLPGVVQEQRPTIGFENALAFLRRLRAIGATAPRPGHRPASPGALRAALRRLDREHGGRVTWHLVYGHLRS